jgi:hypothetical protein
LVDKNQKVVKKLYKSCQKFGKKLAKSWLKGSKNSETENSETVRRRRGGGRRFVVPKPGATKENQQL